MRKKCEITQDGGGDTERTERWRKLKRWEDRVKKGGEGEEGRSSFDLEQTAKQAQ